MANNNSQQDEAALKLQRLSRGLLARLSFKKQQNDWREAAENSEVKAPFVPTPVKAIEAMCSTLLHKEDAMCDLGCGDGRVLIGCAGMLSSGLGVDIQAGVLEIAKQASAEQHHSHLSWIQADFYSEEVKQYLQTTASACFLYLLPELVSELFPYLVTNMKVGSRIICYTFKYRAVENKSSVTMDPTRDVQIPGLPAGACTLYEYVVDMEAKSKFGS